MWLALWLAVLPPSTLVEEVTCTEIAFSQSAERRDLEAFEAFLHPDARFVSGGVHRGPRAIVDAWSVFFEPGGVSIRWRPEHVEVSEDGALALSRGPFRTVRVGPDGKRHEEWGRFISVWRRGEDGRWRVQFDTGADRGMTPSEEVRRILEAESTCES